jgi:hypothetical protein
MKKIYEFVENHPLIFWFVVIVFIVGSLVAGFMIEV